MRPLTLVSLALMLTVVAYGRDRFNPEKPGYAIGTAFSRLGNVSASDFLRDLDQAKKYAATSREADLATLAKDFLGCSILKDATPDKCRLKGDLSRYGYYEPLANMLNEGSTHNFNHIGKLFRCAVDELQGMPHEGYVRCISDFRHQK